MELPIRISESTQIITKLKKKQILMTLMTLMTLMIVMIVMILMIPSIIIIKMPTDIDFRIINI